MEGRLVARHQVIGHRPHFTRRPAIGGREEKGDVSASVPCERGKAACEHGLDFLQDIGTFLLW